jgi:hypothetical protein
MDEIATEFGFKYEVMTVGRMHVGPNNAHVLDAAARTFVPQSNTLFFLF